MKSGELIGKIDRGAGKNRATMTYADGHVYHRYANNVVVMSETSPKGFVKRAEFQFPKSDKGRSPTWTFPVITGGKLYLRDEDTLFCYDLRARKQNARREPDAVFVPTPQDVVDKMLELAQVKRPMSFMTLVAVMDGSLLRLQRNMVAKRLASMLIRIV